MRLFRAFALVGALTVATAAPAFAEDPAPWSVGVTDVQKKEAQRLLEEGNARFLENDFKTALDRYQAAVKEWKHPAIRFNIVRCMIQLNDPIAAADELKLSLEYGAKPFEPDVYREALAYQKLLESQIGELELKCDQPSVAVTLDGKKLFDCPHTEKRRMPPGNYKLVAERPGYLTVSTDVLIMGGKVTTNTVQLDPREKAARIVHRYPTWVPWTVFGGGLVVAGIGALLNVKASSDMDRYDSQVASQCAENGCSMEEDEVVYMNLKDQEQAALTLNKIAIGVIVAGAATAAVGGVMIFMNRGQTVYSESKTSAAPSTAFTVIPTLDGGAMATLSGGF